VHPQQQQQQDSPGHICTAADAPSLAGVEQHIERPCTPQQHLHGCCCQDSSSIHDGGDAAEVDWQQGWGDSSNVAEPWATLPEAVFADIITRVSGTDVG
jgi:hypothetical protein